MKKLVLSLLMVAGIAFTFVNIAEAGQTVDQGQAGAADWPVATGARNAAQLTQVCPGVGISTITALKGRKSIAIFRAPTNTATCFFGFDANQVTTTGSRGVPSVSGDSPLSFDYGDRIPVSVACQTVTTSPGCFQILQAR